MGGSSVAFWQQRAVSPLRLGFASADVGWVIWIEVIITETSSAPSASVPANSCISAIPVLSVLGGKEYSPVASAVLHAVSNLLSGCHSCACGAYQQADDAICALRLQSEYE